MAKKRGLLSRLRTLFSSPKTKQAKSEKILMDWQTMYKDLQSHPLTQAKIINEQLLETTNDTLKKVNKRLDNFDERIDKLEQRRIRVIRKIQEVPEEEEPVKSKGKKVQKAKRETPAQIVKKVIADPHMSDQEKAIVQYIEKQGESDAHTIAEQFHISRSNASLKLNKIHDWGFLNKRMVDKTVFYRIKDD